jgi:hypothetical protein
MEFPNPTLVVVKNSINPLGRGGLCIACNKIKTLGFFKNI